MQLDWFVKCLQTITDGNIIHWARFKDPRQPAELLPD